MLFEIINVREASSWRPRRRQGRVRIQPSRVRRRRAPVAGLGASREEHSDTPRRRRRPQRGAPGPLAASASTRYGFLSRRVWRRGCGCARCASETAGGVPRARGRRVYSEADPGGYYLSALGGRGRTLRLRRANGGGRRCLPSNRVPPARRPCRSEHFAAEPRRVRVGEPEFGCEGNVPSTHHCSAKGPVVRLGAHNNRRRARAPSGVTRESPRAATPQHRKTSARAQPSRRGAPRRAAERRTGLVILNLRDYKLPAVLCYIPLGKPAAGRRYYHPARQPRP